MKLLSDRIQEFIDWLSGYIDDAEWEPSIELDVVHKKLIEIMTEPDNGEQV